MSSQSWRSFTQARVQLGRQGSSVPTSQHLEILEAQALARDSLWRRWDTKVVKDFLHEQQWPVYLAESEARDRQQYLMRPDLGRSLTAEATMRLKQEPKAEIVFCVTDGLATDAIEKHFMPLMRGFLPALQKEAFFHNQRYPFVLLPLARVATADAVAEALGSRLSVIFVGERPGLSAHDSLGIYLTYAPHIGTLDSRRNCISNVRVPNGLSYEVATQQLLFLMRSSLRLGISGVDLKLDIDDRSNLNQNGSDSSAQIDCPTDRRP